MPVLLPDEPDTVYEESYESAMNTGRFSDEPVAASVIPSITTASDTVPTVAVRTALPVPFTVTIPFSSTEKTESSLLLQSNALSVSDGVNVTSYSIFPLSATVGLILLFFHANVPATSVPSTVLYVALPPVRVLSESFCP